MKTALSPYESKLAERTPAFRRDYYKACRPDRTAPTQPRKAHRLTTPAKAVTRG